MKHMWQRILSVSVVMALLLQPAWQSAAAMPTAVPAAAIGLQGKWVGRMQRSLSTKNCVSDPCVTGEGDYQSTLEFKVGPGNTVTEGKHSLKIKVTAQAGSLATVTCTGSADHTLTGSAATGANGLPVFKLKLAVAKSTPILCNGVDTGESGNAGNLTLEAQDLQGNRVSGQSLITEPDWMSFATGNLKKAGATASTKDYWELTNTSPIIESLQPTYERYFLQGIPLENAYQASINWNNNPPGRVVFTLGSARKEVSSPGAQVTERFALGQLAAGRTPLKVVAYTASGQESGPQQTDAIMVPLEPWARRANFTASASGSTVTYKGQLFLPPEPLKLPYLDISNIPIVGGKWGVPPIQLTANLLATSAGGQSQVAPLEGKVALYLGGLQEEFALDIKGGSTTNLQESSLSLAKSQAELTLKPVKLQKQVGLLELVPGMRAVTSAPIIGDLAQVIDSLASAQAALQVDAKGTADIGLNSSRDALRFTQGSLSTRVNATVRFMLNVLGLASAWVGGGGTGRLDLRVAPDPAWQGCSLALQFYAGAQAGKFYEEYKQDWKLLQCAGAFAPGLKVNAAPNALVPEAPMPLRLAPRPADWQPEYAIPAPSTASTLTVLVQNAGTQASPALAVGPRGKLAFVWVGEDAAKPNAQSSEIRLRVYDGKAWSDVIAITQDTLLDFSPAAAFDASGKLVVAWVQNKQAAVGEKIAFDEVFAKNMEIHFALVDPSNGKVLKTQNLTDDQVMDVNPQLARGRDGSLWLAWVKSPGASLVGNAQHPNTVLATQWDGSRWAKPETATDALVGTLTWRLAALDRDHAFVAADRDTDGKLNTPNDREIVIVERAGKSWGKPLQITRNDLPDMAPLATYTTDGRPALAWYSDGQLQGLVGDWQAKPQTWLERGRVSPMLANGSLVAGGGAGELALLWPDALPSLGVWMSHLNPASGQWSAPVAAVAQGQQADAVTVGVGAQGDLVVGLAAMEAVTQTVQLANGESFTLPARAVKADLAMARVEPVFTQAAPPAQSKSASFNWPLLLGGCGCGLLVLILAAVGGWVWLRRRGGQ